MLKIIKWFCFRQARNNRLAGFWIKKNYPMESYIYARGELLVATGDLWRNIGKAIF